MSGIEYNDYVYILLNKLHFIITAVELYIVKHCLANITKIKYNVISQGKNMEKQKEKCLHEL